jgi:carbamoyltransferase
MKGSYLGPEFSDDEIEKSLTNCGAVFNSNSVDEILKITATAIDNGKAIGWFQGKMEFGPRALGARSIIADARSDTMQKNLNLKVKFRENFRPFAPSVLREDVDKWFELDNDSPYMLIVSLVKEKLCRKPTKKETGLFGIDQLNIKRSKIPAVTHVDYSARVQTVHKETNPIYYKLIHKFKEITGCPVIINTSFNVRGEPIVLTPEDAFKCFMGTELDMLVIGNFILYKEQQDKTKLESYKDKYELD